MRTLAISRTSLAVAVILAAVACSSGNVSVVRAPAPAPRRIVPLEITIVRPDAARLLVQTNRPAYLALFEIVPGRGTALVYPASLRQRSVTVSGLNWVNVWWTMQTASNRRLPNDGRLERYVYALASDRPLRISDHSYDPEYLQRVLGSAYRASDPYVTVRALARAFVPAMPDEQWGEDLYALAARETYRIARVYCSDGTVFEVREDMAYRAWCPARRGPSTRGGVPIGSVPGADAPDSVLTANGRQVVRRPFDPGDRTPPFRVPAPVAGQGSTQTQTETQGNGRDDRDNNQGANGRDKDKDKDKDNNGRRSHGDPANADPRGKGIGIGSGNGDDARDRGKPPSQGGRGNVDQPPRSEPQPLPELKLQGEPTKPDTGKPDKAEGQGKPEKQDRPEKQDKPDKPEKSEPQPKPDKVESPDPQVQAKPQPKAEEKPPTAVETLMRKRGPKTDKKAEPARPDSSGGKP